MDHNHHHNHSNHSASTTTLAINATLHCLTGCAIGEIAGLVIATILGLTLIPSIALAIVLAFVFGYSLSIIPLLRNGLSLKKAASIILAADTLSILTMEIVDNLVMTLIPNAMNASLVNPVFWISMCIALTVAFVVTVPVNKYLLSRGKGHALVHRYHNNQGEHS